MMAAARTARRWEVAGVVAALVAASVLWVSCGSEPSRSDPEIGTGASSVVEGGEPLAWAGFDQGDGLVVVDADEMSGIDTMVRFALSGPTADVDAALEAAEFSAPLEPDVEVFQTPLAGVDLDGLVDRRAGRDAWVNSEGQTVNRIVVRGGLDDGTELVHVWAFTT